MVKETKTQHYIPQFYLKRFCNANGTLSVYNKLKCTYRMKCKPENYAAQNYFYNATEDELREILSEYVTLYPDVGNTIDYSDKTLLEKRFAYFEGKISELLRNIDSDSSLLYDESIKIKLAVFMYELSLRTPANLNMNKYMNKVSHEHLEAILPSLFDNPEDYLRDYSPEAARIEQLKGIVSIKSSLAKCLPWLNDYNWVLGINNTDLPFVTTDNPISLLSFGIKDFCFPISSSKAIILRKKHIEDSSFSVHDRNVESDNTINLTLKGIVTYNSYNFAAGYRFVFGDDKAVRLMAISHKVTGTDKIDKSRYF